MTSFLNLSTPIGNLGIHFTTEHIIKIDFLPEATTANPPQNKLAQQIQAEFDAYFQNPKHIFNLPIQLAGTPFQQTVWQALRNLPSGATLSYSALAKQLNTGARAIGNACRTNPIPLIVPCHRITAKNNIGGFTGTKHGRFMAIKKWLLEHEAV